MIYNKTEKRIAQYLTFLDRVKYTPYKDISSDNPAELSWEYAKTDMIFRTPPAEGKAEWKPLLNFPFQFGSDRETWWFRSEIRMTHDMNGYDLFLEADNQTDTLIFVNGEPSGAVNPFHRKFRLTPFYQPDRTIEIALEAWAGHTFPGYHPFDGPRVLTTVAHRHDSYPLTFQCPGLLVKDLQVYGLYYDAAVLYETAILQEENSLLRSRVTRDLHKALLNLDFTADRKTRQQQAADVRHMIKPLLDLKNGSLAPRIFSTGNAHLDHAWLWPISETSRKCARTCANMAAFTEEFPDFRYLHSQPAQMVDLKKNYPAVFNKVRQSIKRGQWEPNGGMWVEADCNIAGGESLIRQFILGHQTTKELFDYRGNVLWLPDVFGYAAGLPQIMKGCGIDYFVTSKISWNDTTRFPYDLFSWRGLDGTCIPVHFIPTAYEGRNTPSEMTAAWNRIQHKDVQSSLMRSIGEGDGGGGTMRSDLEYMSRMADLQGLPSNRWSSLSEAMKQIFQEAGELPEYKGELYLELHRGTYTTQAKIKRYNRKLEYSLRDLEMKEVLLYLAEHSVMKESVSRSAEEIHKVIADSWKRVLTLQFHDILPGTSIQQVNDEALEEYRQITSLLADADQKINSLLINPQKSGQVTVLNTLSFKRNTLIILPGGDSTVPSDLPVQKICKENNERVPAVLVEIDGMALYDLEKCISGKQPYSDSFILNGESLKTPWYAFRFDEKGGICDLVMNRSGRQVSETDLPLNDFVIVEDLPVNWDAWDIEDDYRFKEHRTGMLESREVLSQGPLCMQIRQVVSVGKNSRLTQDLFFYSHTPRIDFRTTIDWQEKHQLLRVNFPTTVAAHKGYFDVPFGYVERETHRNRPEDRAHFEVCAHKWACVQDARLTTALMSDCKYGFRVEGGLLSLTLLRSPAAPDPAADQGIHNFTYAFYPSESLDLLDVIREGWDLNVPVQPITGALETGHAAPLFSLSEECVTMEAVKVSEDRLGIIIRICETTGSPVSLILTNTLGPEFNSWVETDMLEQNSGVIYEMKNEIEISLHQFEVKTIKFFNTPSNRSGVFNKGGQS